MTIAPYLAFAKKSFLQKSAYRLDHWMGILNTLIRLVIYVEIYHALYGGREAVDGITMSMVTTNFILSLGLESFFVVNDYYLSYKINDGSIATEMLLPVSFHGRMLADAEKGLEARNYKALRGFERGREVSNTIVLSSLPSRPLNFITSKKI